jgi:thiol-disulfide isomerase/thioredoxin
MKLILMLIMSQIFFCSHAFAMNPKPGLWRLNIIYSYAKIPFLVEFVAKKNKWHIQLINGKEIIELNEIKATSKKWIIPLGPFPTSLELNFQSPKSLTGFFHSPGKPSVPIEGAYGSYRRFDRPKDEPSVNLNGKWAIQLKNAEGSITDAIALFEQMGQTLHASILTPTGDLRYFDGYVFNNQFKVGGFDGVFHFLFEGVIKDNKISGSLFSRSISTFEGEFNPKAELKIENQNKPTEKLSFKFNDLTGKEISLEDDQYKNKPLILQIFGSWCPNCIDETFFLNNWYKENKNKDIEIICLAFERLGNQADVLKQLKRFQAKMELSYPILIAGVSDSDKPHEKIQGLVPIQAYPTTLFLDKKHQVYKIHAGFNGPGAGIYFSDFKKYFFQTIDELKSH